MLMEALVCLYLVIVLRNVKPDKERYAFQGCSPGEVSFHNRGGEHLTPGIALTTLFRGNGETFEVLNAMERYFCRHQLALPTVSNYANGNTALKDRLVKQDQCRSRDGGKGAILALTRRISLGSRCLVISDLPVAFWMFCN